HAVEMLDAALAPLGIGFQDDFRIARRAEAVPEVLEFPTQRLEVVDATVEDDDEVQFLVHHRLRCALPEIEDLQPTVTEGHPAVGVEAFAVGAAGRLARRHPLYRFAIGGSAVQTNLCYKSTHIKFLGYFPLARYHLSERRRSAARRPDRPPRASAQHRSRRPTSS